MTPSGNDPSDGVINVNPSPMDMTHLARTPDHGPGPSEGDLGLKIPPKTGYLGVFGTPAGGATGYAFTRGYSGLCANVAI